MRGSTDETPQRALARRLVRLALLAAVALVVPFGLSALETSLLYFPSRRHAAQPTRYGLASEELRPRSDDRVELFGWWLRRAGGSGEAGSSPVVIWYLGNGGNVSYALENAQRLIDQLNVEIVTVDYRGYGLSRGAPSEAGLYRDGRAIYDAVRERGVPPERIVLFGRSLGAAVATDVALDRLCAGLVLETPFLSVPSVAKVLYPLIPSFLIQSRYDTERKLPNISVPKLIVQAERDEFFPAEHAPRLFELATPPKRFHVLTGSRHNDVFDERRPDYFDAWRWLLDTAATQT